LVSVCIGICMGMGVRLVGGVGMGVWVVFPMF
jgi:hypothetical protein